MSNLIRPLPTGDVDIIGDVHGEAGALCTLLDRLGYNDKGDHPHNRRLVFVGDLIDRGPNSLGVLEIVMPMYMSGKAFVVVGNHELNLLRKKKKHGNKWFYGERENLFTPKDTDDEKLITHKSFTRCIHSTETRTKILDFFASLPIAMEREDLRVVHACWHEESVQTLKKGNQDIMERYRELEEQLSTQAPPKHTFPSYEMRHLKKSLKIKKETFFYKTTIPSKFSPLESNKRPKKSCISEAPLDIHRANTGGSNTKDHL